MNLSQLDAELVFVAFRCDLFYSGFQAKDFKSAHDHVILCRTKGEVAARVRIGIVHLEQFFAIPVILDQISAGNQLNPLRRVGGQQVFFVRQIILWQQWARVGGADVSPEARGCVGIAALADVVAKELVVVRKFSGAWDSKEIVHVPGIMGHPETIEITHAIVWSPGGYHSGLILNENWALQHRLKPNCRAAGDVDFHFSAADGNSAAVLQFRDPVAGVG